MMSMIFIAAGVEVTPFGRNNVSVEVSFNGNSEVEQVLDEIKEDFIVEYLESKGYTITKE